MAGDPGSVGTAITRWKQRGVDVVIAMDGDAAADRVARLLGEAGYPIPKLGSLDEVQPAVLPVGIHRGFIADWLGVGVVGEQEIAGRRRSHRRYGARRGGELGEGYRDLRPGDHVVHHHHGIGRFEGLVHREIGGVARDYLLLAYHGDDRLYVPTDQLAAVRRYTGGEVPRLSRLGGADWASTRSKVRQAVAAVAEQVVDLHRRRAQATGHAFAADTPWQAEFEASFPYEETADQLTAVAEVKADMESAEPMDRLVFGDVGFGKTEVAMRAAMKAVQNGKQVAMLVPTTLLAQQHHATLGERFAPYPVRVEAMSRFLTRGRAAGRRHRARGRVGRHRHRHPPPAVRRHQVQGPRAPGHRRGAAVRGGGQGPDQAAADLGGRAHPHRHPDSPDAGDGADRDSGRQPHPHRTESTAIRSSPTSGPTTSRPCRRRSGVSCCARARSSTSTTGCSRSTMPSPGCVPWCPTPATPSPMGR